jgi:TetR/AcrR family transcriptional regulator, ethionamide resistance regulator
MPILAVSRRTRRMREASRRAGDVNEAALLDVARELVQSGEFQTASIGQIAKRAGISRPGFYFYYQSKDELLADLATETLHASHVWRDALREDSSTAPVDIIHKLVISAMTMWRDHPEILRAAVEIGPGSPVIFGPWMATVENSGSFLVEMIVSGTTIAALREADAARRMMVTVIWMIERNCYIHFVHGSEESDATLAEKLTQTGTRALGLE